MFRISTTIAAGLLSVALCNVAQPVMAQERLSCPAVMAGNTPQSQQRLTQALGSLDRGFSQPLLNAARDIDQGYMGERPDWQCARDAYELISRRNEGRTFNSLAFHIWVSSLTYLAENYQNGVGRSGWPQDLQRARDYYLRIADRYQSDPAASETQRRVSRERVQEIDGLIAMQRSRSGRVTADFAALSRINRLTLRDPDVGAPHLRAGEFAAVIMFIDPIEAEPGENPSFNFAVNVFTNRLLSREMKGLCLILFNADLPEANRIRHGIWYEHFGNPPFPSPSNPYQGWYRLSVKGGASYNLIEWPIGLAPRTLGFEFRPASDAALCRDQF